MSTFILETKGYDTLGQYLFDYAKSNHIMGSGRKNTTLQFLFGDWREHYNASDEEIRKAVQLRLNNLISANNHAYDERYNSDEHDDMIETEPEYFEFKQRHILPAWSDIQVIKHLQCLRYQLSEGDVPETEIYKLLGELIAGLCEAKVSNMNEYDNASWGW